MSHRFIVFATLLIPLIFLAACATSRYGQGRAELEKDNFRQAIVLLEAALEENPDNPNIIRDLGIAHYCVRDFSIAIDLLAASVQKNPGDGKALFYLGTAYEITENYKKALETYRQYSNVSRFSKIRKSLEGRMRRLLMRQIEEDVAKALAEEKMLDTSSIPENSVAVLYFKNIGSNKDLDPLQKGITDMVITDLSQVQKLNVIERARMQKLMEEIGLGMTGLVSASTTPRVGKLLGVSEIVNGVFSDLKDDNIRIDAGVANTISEEFQMAKHVTGALGEFFRLEKSLVFIIIDHFGITLTQAERDAIRIVPTENLLAFLAYCNGLDYEDKELYRDAIDAYNNALELDPNFQLARDRMEELEAYLESDIDIEQWVREMESVMEPRVVMGAPVLDRLLNSQQGVCAGFSLGVDSRKPVEENVAGTALGGAAIVIEIDLPEEQP